MFRGTPCTRYFFDMQVCKVKKNLLQDLFTMTVSVVFKLPLYGKITMPDSQQVPLSLSDQFYKIDF